MPRDGLGQYSPPPGTNGITNFTIESSKYNGFVADITADQNNPRPVVAGGTAATTVDGALDNLSAEKFKQVVTDWTTNVWRAGSFYAATTATGAAPITGKAFAGIVYYANATDFVIEATNLTDPGGVKYIRTQTAGVWSNWATVDTSKKNYIINGAMMVSQEWGTTALSAVGQYPADMFSYYAGSTTGVVAFGQAGGRTPGGSTARIRFTVTTADAAVAAGDYSFIYQSIEGLRAVDLKLGTASAKTVTLQFGVKAPAGTYCVAFYNSNASRSYVAEYVIAAGEANTDVIKTITLALDTAGTWQTGNVVGISVQWTLMAGTTYQTTANVWTGTGTPYATANQYNFMGTFGNVFELFDVSLTEGTVAPPFVVPDYASELALCERYFERGYGMWSGYVASAGVSGLGYVARWRTQKRAGPTLTGVSHTSSASFPAIAGTLSAYGTDGWTETRVPTAVDYGGVFVSLVTGNARL